MTALEQSRQELLNAVKPHTEKQFFCRLDEKAGRATTLSSTSG